MKNTKHILFLCGIIILIVYCCSKSNDSNSSNSKDIKSRIAVRDSDIMGDWHNLTDSLDTLHISIKDSSISRWHKRANCVCFFYGYNTIIDTIIIDYIGIDKVTMFPHHSKIYLNKYKDTLTIQTFSSVYPAYKGNTFKKL